LNEKAYDSGPAAVFTALAEKNRRGSGIA
jgi:hypothetical protein